MEVIWPYDVWPGGFTYVTLAKRIFGTSRLSISDFSSWNFDNAR